MTKDELIAELDAKAFMVHENTPRNTRYGTESVTVNYLENKDGVLVEGKSEIYIINNNAYWFDRKPSIIVEKPESVPIMSEEEIKLHIEGLSVDYNVLYVNINKRSGDDIVSADIDDGSVVISKRYRVWEVDAEQWVQPTGAHDAYPINSVVSHNGKTWKALVDANVWEPGTDATLWEEVQSSQIREIA